MLKSWYTLRSVEVIYQVTENEKHIPTNTEIHSEEKVRAIACCQCKWLLVTLSPVLVV